MKCVVFECTKESKVKGYCRPHYKDNWKLKNRALDRIYSKRNYYENGGKEDKKAYAEKNKEKIKAYKKTYHKKYYTKNKQRILARLIRTRKIKYKVDPQFRLRICVAVRLASAMKHGYVAGTAIESLGCSIKEFKQYLEKKFKPGMTWDNYGYNGWHVDHIKPLCIFDLTDKNQLAEAAHYTNMQPLWKDENFKKGGKYDPKTR